ncbi:hypothetical protein HOU31_gp52 [Acinetobacter phage vB_AbaP_46-62_Aci07]|uniref:Uncharacterized protein n=1 Tax=Acinetobacter phage vB_AbaP_46-62_Aci07 TaxID=2315468 RepID=A0A386KJU9_9CAUD|nr:hypothetical protein HOU31_gp52 [Acinetobacter phage vB_AbaP_46-62_Aci07]AYD85905.1 hypothetical protein Aci07_52 [Acinetobacter phage vB_AbaP_46-62_Aci07]
MTSITDVSTSVEVEYNGETIKVHPVYLSTEVVMKLQDIGIQEGYEYLYEDTVRKLLGI